MSIIMGKDVAIRRAFIEDRCQAEVFLTQCSPLPSHSILAVLPSNVKYFFIKSKTKDESKKNIELFMSYWAKMKNLVSK